MPDTSAEPCWFCGAVGGGAMIERVSRDGTPKTPVPCPACNEEGMRELERRVLGTAEQDVCAVCGLPVVWDENIRGGADWRHVDWPQDHVPTRVPRGSVSEPVASTDVDVEEARALAARILDDGGEISATVWIEQRDAAVQRAERQRLSALVEELRHVDTDLTGTRAQLAKVSAEHPAYTLAHGLARNVLRIQRRLRAALLDLEASERG